MKKIEYSEFGKWLKHFCIDQDLTQAQLGKLLGVSEGLVSHIVSGRKRVPKDFIYILGERYNIDKDTVMGYIEAHNKEVKANNKSKIVSYTSSDSKRIECAKVLIEAVRGLDDMSVLFLRDCAKSLMKKKEQFENKGE